MIIIIVIIIIIEVLWMEEEDSARRAEPNDDHAVTGDGARTGDTPLSTQLKIPESTWFQVGVAQPPNAPLPSKGNMQRKGTVPHHLLLLQNLCPPDTRWVASLLPPLPVTNRERGKRWSGHHHFYTTNLIPYYRIQAWEHPQHLYLPPHKNEGTGCNREGDSLIYYYATPPLPSSRKV